MLIVDFYGLDVLAVDCVLCRSVSQFVVVVVVVVLLVFWWLPFRRVLE